MQAPFECLCLRAGTERLLTGRLASSVRLASPNLRVSVNTDTLRATTAGSYPAVAQDMAANDAHADCSYLFKCALAQANRSYDTLTWQPIF